MNAARAEAAFWSAFLRNRNVDAGTSADGALPVAGGFALCLAGTFLEHGDRHRHDPAAAARRPRAC